MNKERRETLYFWVPVKLIYPDNAMARKEVIRDAREMMNELPSNGGFNQYGCFNIDTCKAKMEPVKCPRALTATKGPTP